MSVPRRPSRTEAESHLAQLENTLYSVHKGENPPADAIAWPSGLDRAILSEFPLSTRTRNCLNREKLTSGSSQLVVQTLMRISNFGSMSLVELLLTLEQYLIERTLVGNVPINDSFRQVSSLGASNQDATQELGNEELSKHSNEVDEILLSLTTTISRLGAPPRRWYIATESLKTLLATSAEVIGTPTLADVLKPELMRLAHRMGLDDALRSIGLHEATLGVPSLPVRIVRRLRETLNALDERQCMIVQNRLTQTPKETLESVGRQLGVTRERVRQMQSRLEQKIENAFGEELHVIASTMHERLDPLTPTDELIRQIDQIFPDDSEPVATLFRNAMIRAMRLNLRSGLYATELAEQVISDIRLQAHELADDVGLLREHDLVSYLPSKAWLRFWPWLRRLSGIHSFYGSLALRDSAKARAKAALLSLGHPATREEIGAVCGQETNRVGASLSNIPSVVKADRDRWALNHWIDDEYEGIVSEIVQRIEEDGGVTTTERVLKEIPAKFNVSPQSVRMYISSSRFEVRNGSISLANPASIRLRDLDDVIDGRDNDGAPYWTFVVMDRYFKGYSVVGLPPEFAKALGCEPDSGVSVEIRNLPDCRALSVNWRLGSLTGASLGYLARPLELLGLQPGDQARVTIAAKQTVVLTRDEVISPSKSSLDADATLERLLRRRRAI